jgi:hypothetical protein
MHAPTVRALSLRGLHNALQRSDIFGTHLQQQYIRLKLTVVRKEVAVTDQVSGEHRQLPSVNNNASFDHFATPRHTLF